MTQITFITHDGAKYKVDGPHGLSILEIAHLNNIDIEGACGGSLACATCHVIIDPTWYSVLNPPSVEEENMLDLAFGLTSTSRLSCQIIVTQELDGLVIVLPSGYDNGC